MIETTIFTLRFLSQIRAIEVYDDFAIVIFEDNSVLLAVRPTVLGGLASYNTVLTSLDSNERQ